MARLKIHNGTVVTLGDTPAVFPRGEVICDGPRIETVGPEGSTLGSFDRTLDARGGLIMPGLINAHMHLYSTFARGMALPGPPPSNFVQILQGLWWKLDRALRLDDVEVSALVPLIACLYNGTTTIIDHHASPGAARGSLAAIGRALDQIPVRASLCYEVSDRDGPRVLHEGIDENLAWHDHTKQQRGDHLQAALFGLHAAFTLGDESLRACSDAGRRAGLGFHVHTAEDRADQDHNTAHYGLRVVARLEAFDVLGEGTICVHCVHVDDDEIARLARTRTFVVHNPQSNMNNAVGTLRLGPLLANGVRLGLGTDGMASDVRADAATVPLLQRASAGNPRLGFGEAGRLLFEGNRTFASAHFGLPLGVLTPGAAADVAVFAYDPPTPLTVGNFLGHFLFGVRYVPARHVVVAGQALLEDGRVTCVDETAVAARSRELSQALWKRLGIA